MAAQSVTPSQWASSLLHRLGIHQSPGAVQALVGWQRAEGGHWKNDARFNPLNTTQPAPGAGNTGSQGNIKVYRDWNQGLDATVATLKNGRYAGILSALQAGDPSGVAAAIGRTPWGTSGDLVGRAIAGTPVVRGAKPIGGSSRGVRAPAATVAGGVDQSGAQQLAVLLAQAQQQEPVQRQSVGLQTPEFAARAPVPEGAQPVLSSGGPVRAPGRELASALTAVSALGGPGATAAPAKPAAAPRAVSRAKGRVEVTGPNPGRVQSDVVDFLRSVSAVRGGRPIVTSDGTGHSKYTVNGNVSEHFTGNATDTPARGRELVALGQAALIAAGMPRAQARQQTGGLFNLTRNGRRYQIIFNTHEGGDHTDHLHTGVKRLR